MEDRESVCEREKKGKSESKRKEGRRQNQMDNSEPSSFNANANANANDLSLLHLPSRDSIVLTPVLRTPYLQMEICSFGVASLQVKLAFSSNQRRESGHVLRQSRDSMSHTSTFHIFILL